MSPRHPRSLLTLVPPCSWTYVGDVLFVCSPVLGRQTLGETEEEEVSVGAPPCGAKHLLRTTIPPPGLPNLGVSAENPWDQRTTFQDFCLRCPESFSRHPVLRLLFFMSLQTKAPESGPSSIQKFPMVTPFPQSLAPHSHPKTTPGAHQTS